MSEIKKINFYCERCGTRVAVEEADAQEEIVKLGWKICKHIICPHCVKEKLILKPRR